MSRAPYHVSPSFPLHLQELNSRQARLSNYIRFVHFIRLNIKGRKIATEASNFLRLAIPLIRLLIICSTRHHARRSPSTGGCHTHASHSHSSTPGSSPLHAPAGLLSPHRAMPTSHMGQTIACGAHRLSIGGSTIATIAGNGGSPTSQSVPTPTPAFANVAGIELNEVQPGKFSILLLKLYHFENIVPLCIGKIYSCSFLKYFNILYIAAYPTVSTVKLTRK